jgi:hypothetical protein
MAICTRHTAKNGLSSAVMLTHGPVYVQTTTDGLGSAVVLTSWSCVRAYRNGWIRESSSADPHGPVYVHTAKDG